MATELVQIESEVYAELKGMAEPFVDTPSSVIARLIAHYKCRPPGSEAAPHDPLMTKERLDEFVGHSKRLQEGLRTAQFAKMLNAAPGSKLVDEFGKLSDLLKIEPDGKGGWKMRDTGPHVPPAEEVFSYEARPTHFLTSRGVALPIGLRLFADYQGKRLTALVTQYGFDFNGVVHSNPSQAAMAAKQSMGASQKASSTNGWTFWLIDDASYELAGKTLDHFRQLAGQKLHPDDGSEE
jgi:hypothetical protein